MEQLTKFQRLLLIQNHEMLEKLDTGNAEHHAKMQEVYRAGYVSNYDDDFGYLNDEMSREDADLVNDVLDMYLALQSCALQVDKEGSITSDLRFRGFDGNNEPTLMAYTRFVVEKDERFEEVARASFNSHQRMRDTYVRMVETWKAKGIPGRYHLTIEDIQRILEA